MEDDEISPFSVDVLESLTAKQLRMLVMHLHKNNDELINQLQQLTGMYLREQEKNNGLQTIIESQQERMVTLENENESMKHSWDEVVLHSAHASKLVVPKTSQMSKELALSTMSSLPSYHSRLRDNLRVMAECLCDELCRVDDHLSLLAPLVATSETASLATQQQLQPHHLSSTTAAGTDGNNKKGTSPLTIGATPKSTTDNTGFLFGSPSARFGVSITSPLHTGIVEGPNDDEEEGD